MNTVLQRLLSNDLADLRGASIRATIPIPETFLNEAANEQVRARRGRIKQFDIQVGTDNYLQIGVQVSVGPFTKWFRPEVIVSAEPPVILVTVASSEYGGLMWLAELFAKELLPQGVRISGRQVILDLRETPNLAPYRNLLGYVKALRISTRRGTVVIVLEGRID